MEEEDESDFEPEEPQKNPRQTANVFSILCFCYTLDLFRRGMRTVLTENDLYDVLDRDSCQYLGDRLELEWNKELKKEKPSLFRAIFRMFAKEFYLYCCVVFGLQFLRCSQVIALYYILLCYEPEDNGYTNADAYKYTTWIAFSLFMFVMCSHSYAMGLQHMGMRIRVACSALVYRKCVRLSLRALATSTIGQMVNMLSNDVSRFDYVTMHLPYLMVFPIETPALLYAMYVYVGCLSYIGCFAIFGLLPVLVLMGMWISRVRSRISVKTDERVRLMGEIIAGIKVIKMYVWEVPFTQLITEARRTEMKDMLCLGYLKGIILSFAIFMTKFGIFLTLVAYVYMGHVPTAEFIFLTVAFLNIIKQSVTIFIPYIIAYVSETAISIRRLKAFLLLHEHAGYGDAGARKTVGITMERLCATWGSETDDATIQDFSLEVEEQEIVAVVGGVGSGKSSLLYTILGELTLIRGTIHVKGKVSYSAQEPWLFYSNIRQNILFGEEYDRVKYNEVVEVCALKRDFSLFPYGDETAIGERGVNLSGGQKARIGLARAVYKDADIYLLDDPLSAVDAQSGRHILNECILGYLAGKCRILVTHQLQHLQTLPRIIMLKNGEVFFDGDFTGLTEVAANFTKTLNSDVIDDVYIKKPNPTKLTMNRSTNLQISQEKMFAGKIKRGIYCGYFKAGGGGFLIFIMFFLFLAAQAFSCACDIYLMIWVNAEKMGHVSDDRINRYTLTYSLLVFGLGVISLTRILYFCKYFITASTRLHNEMFKHIIEAPMSFFDRNPSGRILNRFSKDIGLVDDTLPIVTFDTLQIGLYVLGVMVLVSMVNQLMILPIVILAVVFYVLKHYYLKTGRNIKRVESISMDDTPTVVTFISLAILLARSPVFTHLNSSLQGLVTIRAAGAETTMTREYNRLQNRHSSAWHAFLCTARAFGFLLDLICCVLISLVCYTMVIYSQDHLPGNVGLVLTQSLTLTGLFQWGMRQWSEMENQMTSVERIIDYTTVPKEESVNRVSQVPPDWPAEGRIEFSNVCMRYTETGPIILNELDLTVNPREKIGIVGRTGAGKSSLIGSIFQLSRTTGEIRIDGVDIHTVPLKRLRSSIAIIPQEPMLFKASLRKNLDPFDEYADGDIWAALSEVRLLDTLDLPRGLDTLIHEGGSNYSIGQKQLLCLARAVLKRNSIMVMDEATANVDPHTDTLIQETIREKFKQCTVLTIAHRLDTVIDCDKVLLIDQGRRVEFDHPHLLLEKKEGMFYTMVENTGKMMADALKQLAKQSYEAKQAGIT